MKWDTMIYYERRDAKNEGRIEGKCEGKREGKQEDILELLEDLGTIPTELREKVSAETNLEQLKKWLKLAVKVDTIEEFIEKM